MTLKHLKQTLKHTFSGKCEINNDYLRSQAPFNVIFTDKRRWRNAVNHHESSSIIQEFLWMKYENKDNAERDKYTFFFSGLPTLASPRNLVTCLALSARIRWFL